MIEPPDLSDATILACVREAYAIDATTIEFLPLGNDSNSWVYKVSTLDDGSWFLKVKSGTTHAASLSFPRYLYDQGIKQVIAPLRTKTGALWQEIGNYRVILYPFVDGEMGAVTGISHAQWIEFGATLHRIHTIDLSSKMRAQLRTETFIPKSSVLTRGVQALIAATDFEQSAQREMVALWRERDTEISRIVDRAEELALLAKQRATRLVPCHADIHTYNVLIDKRGRFFIVDWDEAIIAPKERDLMFIGGVIEQVSRHREESLFYEGYGSRDIDPVIMAYYLYEWVVQEFGAYGELVFLTDVGEATKAQAIHYFSAQFNAGGVVQAAYQSELALPPELRHAV